MATTDDSRISKPARRSQTCDTCKARHQKCNGARPQCSNCELRDLHCSYSGARSKGPDQAPPAKSPALASTLLGAAQGRLAITDAQYSLLRDQLLDDIVLRGFYSRGDRHPLPAPTMARDDHKHGVAQFQAGNASLPAFHQQISDLVKIYVGTSGGSPLSTLRHDMEPPLIKNSRHARKILGDSLPPSEKSRRLLDMFLEYQNSVFHVYKRNEVQEQLNLIYEDAEQVSLAWFCQIFLIFAVGVQFDDVDEDEGAAYHELGRKYIDEALDEDPEKNLWVIRAMLLICFYQPPTKWTTLWIYLDTAIRRAHRHQLDLGQNPSQGLTDEEYDDWRQLWLTVISFDRWVAVFLGRLPHIKESISRDPIFKVIENIQLCLLFSDQIKNHRFQQNLDYCTAQNSITSLAIIMGYILRNIYFPETPDQTVFQQHQQHLETWLRNLPGPLQQQVESGLIDNVAQDQYEAVFNLHFMHHGAWILLTRPMLLRAVKVAAITANSIGSVTSQLSTTLAEGRACIQHAIQLITSSAALLSTSLPPKRLFMPVFFLVYAAHVVVLGLAWRLWTQPGVFHDQDVETEAMNTAIRVLDFCGQRNTFARKYSFLIKELRSQVEAGPSSPGRVSTTASTSVASVSPYVSSQMLGIQNSPSPNPMSHGESLGPLSSSSYSYTIPGKVSGQESGANQAPVNVESRQHSLSTELGGMSFESWLEQSRASGPSGDLLFPGFATMQNPNPFTPHEDTWE